MGNARRRPKPAASPTVHPHVHGERVPPYPRWTPASGSSPRAWGTPLQNTDIRNGLRFIPTCMGNAWSARGSGPQFSVHPHVHGERKGVVDLASGENGSSPRAWGTPEEEAAFAPIDRFIPTCMGNARCWRSWRRRTTVHPHVHGERHLHCHSQRQQRGSSPRAWGTRDDDHNQRDRFRFIPTCMGNAAPAGRLSGM